MRYLIPLIAAALLGGCALAEAIVPGAAQFSREKFRDGLDLYCVQSLPTRMENRTWINANSPHTIEVTCQGDEAAM